MNIRLHQATTALLTGLLLIGGNALAEDKKEPITTTSVERIKTITFEDTNRIYLFISPLPLALPINDGQTIEIPWLKPKAKKKSVQVYCRQSDLEGSKDTTGSFSFVGLGTGPTKSLLPCDTSRFIAKEGATISVIYVDTPEQRIPLKTDLEIGSLDKRKPTKINQTDARNDNATKSKDMNSPPVAKISCSGTLILPELNDFTETERTTLIASQIKQAIKYLDSTQNYLDKSKDEQTDDEAPENDNICAWQWAEYTLTKKRAAIQASTVDPVKVDTPLSFKVISGSKEHFFLSVDAIFKDVKQLKAAAKSKDDIQGKPEHVFLSLNYMAGDVYGTLPSIDYRRLVIKGMITPNQQLDSYGFGLGYRLPGKFSLSTSDNEDHSGVVIFVGRFWTRPAKSPLDIPNTDSRRIASTSIGISYSLGAALDWLVPKK